MNLGYNLHLDVNGQCDQRQALGNRKTDPWAGVLDRSFDGFGRVTERYFRSGPIHGGCEARPGGARPNFA
ncbi:MAG: hypothetical protein F4X77_07995 [Acidobacteriia bacterium]|nr:hypothetical protein [Terriglobia bacterium]MYC68195.1 hypothetical protein [Terriglobia bacterium]